MVSTFSLGGFIGANLEVLLVLCGGAYLAWLQPRAIHAQAERGEITKSEAEAKLKKFRVVGYCLLVAGLCQLIVRAIHYQDYELFWHHLTK